MSTNLNDLASFVAVAELGTISAAAAAEGVPKSTISRRVARLENDLGVALLRRSARSFSLTAEGRSLQTRARGALRELTNATAALTEQSEQPSGRLVITAPEDLGSSAVVVELLAAYAALYPEVELELRLLGRFVDLVAEEVDVGLRIHTTITVPGDGELITRHLGTMQAALYAAPGYVERHGAPEAPEAIAAHPCVMHRTFVRQPPALVGEGGEEAALVCEKIVFRGNSMLLAGAMVERGLGIGLLPKFVAEEAAREGRLVRVLPGWSARAGELSMIWPSSRHLALRVRAFVDLARKRLALGHWMCAA